MPRDLLIFKKIARQGQNLNPNRIQHPQQHRITPGQLRHAHKLIGLVPLVHAARAADHRGDAHGIE